MSKNLYVGNLSFEITEEDLKKNFGQIGECISARVIKDKYSGRSKGFGFVEMANEQDAREAIEKFNGTELCGRKLTVNEAKPRAERNDTGRSGFRRRGRY
jgi:RNA recognition motif-containing protein